MHRLGILLIILGMSACLALAEHYAFINFWYWRYWWFDVLMHLAGGVVIGLLVYVCGGRRATILYGVLLVGLVWELFEFMLGISAVERNFVFDTVKDLSMDLIGAALVYGIMGRWIPSPSPLPVEHDASPDQTSS